MKKTYLELAEEFEYKFQSSVDGAQFDVSFDENGIEITGKETGYIYCLEDAVSFCRFYALSLYAGMIEKDGDIVPCIRMF